MKKMTDRDLLELAAKAMEVPPNVPGGSDVWGVTVSITNGVRSVEHWVKSTWNPLIDDGQALRLAQHVGMNLMFANVVGMSVAAAGFEDGSGHARVEIIEQHDGDAMKATRYAIVRAAAAVGKEMP